MALRQRAVLAEKESGERPGVFALNQNLLLNLFALNHRLFVGPQWVAVRPEVSTTSNIQRGCRGSWRAPIVEPSPLDHQHPGPERLQAQLSEAVDARRDASLRAAAAAVLERENEELRRTAEAAEVDKRLHAVGFAREAQQARAEEREAAAAASAASKCCEHLQRQLADASDEVQALAGRLAAAQTAQAGLAEQANQLRGSHECVLRTKGLGWWR